MPQFTTSAFNRGGSWQSDAMDQSDQFNAQRQMQGRNDDLMRQLALARLQSEDNRFGAARQDAANAQAAEYGFRGKQMDQATLFHNQNRQDSLAHDTAELGYRTGRDAANDKRYQQGWEYEHPEWEQKGREERFNAEQEDFKTRAALNRILAKEALDRETAAAAARNGTGPAAAPFTPKTQEGKDVIEDARLYGIGAGEAAYKAQRADRESIRNHLTIPETQFGDELSGVREKENSWTEEPDPKAVNKAIAFGKNLMQQYRDAGDTEADAQYKVQQILKKQYPKVSHMLSTFMYSGTPVKQPRDLIYEALGMTP